MKIFIIPYSCYDSSLKGLVIIIVFFNLLLFSYIFGKDINKITWVSFRIYFSKYISLISCVEKYLELHFQNKSDQSTHLYTANMSHVSFPLLFVKPSSHMHVYDLDFVDIVYLNILNLYLNMFCWGSQFFFKAFHFYSLGKQVTSFGSKKSRKNQTVSCNH